MRSELGTKTYVESSTVHELSGLFAQLAANIAQAEDDF